ncbi:MAG: L-seryl-tRNA(Ser) seleniumtransferase [Gammaproteobacteria bacterium]|jgi:L-seryl-tRNA(Ser) seleniumtransferase
MPSTSSPLFAAIPSLDRLLQRDDVRDLSAAHGRALVTDCLRESIAALRKRIACDGAVAVLADPDTALVEDMSLRVDELLAPSLRAVFNLTGTVLHTNLGRAPLPAEAIEAMVRAAGAANVEYELAAGKRGERDDHVQRWLCRLTGAEAALVVNNNAAAVLLMLNTLAVGREVPVSRGELIEIGGAFRMPDIMARAGCTLVEVGTTNRTHLKDFADAINERSALLMKVHTSNYVVTGFTASVEESVLAKLAHEHGIAFIDDLGSGTLVDMSRFGLPREPTPADALAQGADLVSFSGDKLLGGPQCGIIVGRKDLVEQLRTNPMKRAMRLDKVTLAALEAVLKLYADPDRLVERLPSLRLLARKQADIAVDAVQIVEALQPILKAAASIAAVDCASQIGSGALPVESLPSSGIAITPLDGSGSALQRLAVAFRALPVPVIGHIREGALIFDLRCLEDVPGFIAQARALKV